MSLSAPQSSSAPKFGVTAKQVINLLENSGYELTRRPKKGSHRQYKGPTGLVTVADHGKQDIPKGTLGSIARQMGLSGPELKQQLNVKA